MRPARFLHQLSVVISLRSHQLELGVLSSLLLLNFIITSAHGKNLVGFINSQQEEPFTSIFLSRLG